MIEDYKPGVSIAAGGMMMKWAMLNQHLSINPIAIKPGDDVNVFINLENVLSNLSMYRGLNPMITFHKQKLVIELESAILNLMANYKMYFRKDQCNVKMYFYITDLHDNEQQMKVFNKYYRNYYHNTYMKHPQFRQMGELLCSTILPEIKLILFYVPDCYYIESRTFDSSIIPYVISTFSSSKNVIITGDIFDTLYLFNPNFATIYIKRLYRYFNVTSEIDTTVQSIIKDESPFDLTLFNSEMYYRLLLSIKGSKIRNIKSAKGLGYGKFMNILKDGIKDGLVLKDFESLDSIIQLFPAEYQDDIKQAFQCTSIDTQYALLSDTDIEGIKSQMVDKVDMQSLDALNNRRFLDFPINLQGLIS